MMTRIPPSTLAPEVDEIDKQRGQQTKDVTSNEVDNQCAATVKQQCGDCEIQVNSHVVDFSVTVMVALYTSIGL